MNKMTAVAPGKPAPKKKPKGGSFKGEFYRQCRLWHGYISAFAFLALMFFSFTGLLLNHPEWLKMRRPAPAEQRVILPAAALARAKAAPEIAAALAQAVSGQVKLRGSYASGEVIDNEAMLRFEGVSGASDVVVDLDTGAVEASVQKSDATTIMHDLHKGKNSGAAWKFVIDLSAVLIMALSVVGFILFFSLRFRLRTALILTGLSVVGLLSVFLLLTP